MVLPLMERWIPNRSLMPNTESGLPGVGTAGLLKMSILLDEMCNFSFATKILVTLANNYAGVKHYVKLLIR